MQGQLRNERLTVTIHTSCAHCGQPIEIELDSQLHDHGLSEGAEPLVFQPHVNWETFDEPTIIDAY